VLPIPASPNTPTSRQGTQVGPIRRFPCAGSVHSGCTLPASEDKFLNLLCAHYAAFIQASMSLCNSDARLTESTMACNELSPSHTSGEPRTIINVVRDDASDQIFLSSLPPTLPL
jgi:hypothetical protein